jgi:hypothetical protein
VSTIIGVHGIAQQQLGRHQLQSAWALALADGLEASAGRPVSVPNIDIAFYGNIFLPSNGKLLKGSVADDGLGPEWDGLTDADAEELAAIATETLSEELIATALDGPPDKDLFSRIPLPLQSVTAALDRRFGARGTGLLLLGELRQVRRYLLDQKLKVNVDTRVATMAASCQILIGHSLGSVVAFEYVRQHPDHQLPLLLTLGSPLGLQTIQHLLPNPSYGAATGIPPNVGAWVNLRDPRDPVTCGVPLTSWWPGIKDGLVDNEKKAHSVEHYLSKKQTGDAIYAAAPELTP